MFSSRLEIWYEAGSFWSNDEIYCRVWFSPALSLNSVIVKDELGSRSFYLNRSSDYSWFDFSPRYQSFQVVFGSGETMFYDLGDLFTEKTLEEVVETGQVSQPPPTSGNYILNWLYRRG